MVPMSTTTVLHRPGCTRPGWTVEPARSIAGVVIARCTGCGAVELRRAEQEGVR